MNPGRSRRLLSQLADMREAASALGDALVLLDRGGRVRWLNPSATRLLGLGWPADRGVVLAARLAGSELGNWLAADVQEPADDIPAPAAAAVRLHASMIPFGDRQRLLLARDISRLTRLEQVRRDFVANVSHELRTPLTVIHGYLELLDPEDVPMLAPVLKEMRTQSRRMAQIVEDLLTLSRLEMQQTVADDQRVDMAALLATLRREAEALSKGRHLIELEDHAGVDLAGSAHDLHSAFSNLVSNAVRYTPPGGCITISWKRTLNGAEYAVRDTGQGIPPEHLARLTERFYRVSSSRARTSGGTGLGLSIVKHVLNLHGAELRVRSTPGEGSVFAGAFGRSRLLARDASA